MFKIQEKAEKSGTELTNENQFSSLLFMFSVTLLLSFSVKFY